MLKFLSKPNTKSFFIVAAIPKFINFTQMNFGRLENTQMLKSKMETFTSFNPQEYDEIKALLPKNSSGIVKLDPQIFNKAVSIAKNEADIDFLLTVVADYMGNFRPLSGNQLDEYTEKAIEFGCPNKLIPLLSKHRAMMYYPNPNLITKIMTLHDLNKNWAAMKEFYQAIARKYYIKKQNEVFNIFIQNAFANKAYLEAVNAFLDILDYDQTILQKDTYIQLIYSDQDKFLKDQIFVQLLEKSLKTSNVETVGTVLPLFVFHYTNKNEEATNDYLKRLLSIGKLYSVEVYEAQFMKDFLTELSTTESEVTKSVKEVINNLPENIFDPCYNHLLNSLKI